MEHGRDHDTRRVHINNPRANNTPVDDTEQDALEAEMDKAGRGSIRPHEGLIGAHTKRGAHSDSGDARQGEEPTGPGSDVAPTAKAAEREQERHRLERQIGRTPAGEDGLIREHREPCVTREALDEAARQADEAVGFHGKR